MISYEVVFWGGVGLIFVGLIVPILLWREAQKGVMFTSLTTLAGYLAMRVGGGFRFGADVSGVGAAQLEAVGGINTIVDVVVIVSLTALCWRSAKLQYNLDLRKPERESLLVQTLRLVDGLRGRPQPVKQPDRKAS